MSPQTQKHKLRFLQGHEYRAIGYQKEVKKCDLILSLIQSIAVPFENSVTRVLRKFEQIQLCTVTDSVKYSGKFEQIQLCQQNQEDSLFQRPALAHCVAENSNEPAIRVAGSLLRFVGSSFFLVQMT